MDKNDNKIRKAKWANRSLTAGIFSLLLCMCAVPMSGVSMGIPLGIFAIAFALISKDGKYSDRAMAGIVTGSIGIIIGAVLYAVILYSAVRLRDPGFANEVLEMQEKLFKETLIKPVFP